MQKRLILTSVMIALLVSGFIGGSVYQQQADQNLAHDVAVAQMDHDQELIYNATVAAQMVSPFRNATGTSCGDNSNKSQADICPAVISDFSIQYFVEIFYAAYFPNGSISHGPNVNQTLLNQGYTADCVQRCFNGINYFKDPTTLITNQGRGVEQCSVFHGTGVTDTCTTTNVASYEGWSTKLQSGQTVNATDAWSGTHQSCSTGGGGTYLIVDANGLRDVAATVTAAANGATVSTSLAKTFSITGTYTAVQVACLLSGTGTNADSGTNPLIYAEATFGPDTFHSGDGLTGVWVISRT